MRTRNRIASTVVAVGAVTAAAVATTAPTASATNIEHSKATAVLKLAAQAVGVKLPICYASTDPSGETCVGAVTPTHPVDRIELIVEYAVERSAAPPETKGAAGYPLGTEDGLPAGVSCIGKTGVVLGVIGGHTATAVTLKATEQQKGHSAGQSPRTSSSLPHALPGSKPGSTTIYTCLPI